MADRLASLSIELLADDATAPPKEFRVFSKGPIETSKGTFQFTDGSAKSVLSAAKRRGNDFAIDYGHAMHSPLSVDPAEAGKAAGWFTLDVRDGELWAKTKRWTPRATKMLSEHEYRYISPTFTHDDEGEIQELLSVALTNIPATYGLTPLMASQLWGDRLGARPEPASPESRMKTLLAALSLKEDATEAEAVTALSKTIAPLTELLSLTAKSDMSEMLGVVKAWKAGHEQTTALSARVAELENAATKSAVDVLLADAKKAGKVTPAQEGVLRDMGLTQLKAFLAVAPVVVHGRATELPASDGVTMLTDLDRLIAKQMGVDVKDIAASKARHAGAIPIGEPKATTEDGKTGSI